MTELPIYCLIIDDNNDVLQGLKLNLERPANFSLGSQDINRSVEVRTVNINCSTHEGKAIIDQSSIEQLSKALAERTHFVFTDFAFVSDQEASDQFRSAQNSTRARITTDHCRPFTAYLTDTAHANAGLAKALASFTGGVVVYTNSFPPFNQLFLGNELKARQAEFQLLFPHASKLFIYNIYEALRPLETAPLNTSASGADLKTLMSTVLAMRLYATLWETTYRQLVADQHRRRKRFSRRSI